MRRKQPRAADGPRRIPLPAEQRHLVTHGWLSTLIGHLRRMPQVGLIGPVSNRVGNEAKMPVGLPPDAEMPRWAADYCRRARRRNHRHATLAFSACLSAARCTRRSGRTGLAVRHRVFRGRRLLPPRRLSTATKSAGPRRLRAPLAGGFVWPARQGRYGRHFPRQQAALREEMGHEMGGPEGRNEGVGSREVTTE